ncbi:lamin tail domain-containing protein [Propionibacteriaceae bacterium G57]|uniref:lamin tail domain-containing protein n=1 Tax=Aestuariimicrobium sp. G57 TaxID=3418485 RepID=UPI003DA72ABA
MRTRRERTPGAHRSAATRVTAALTGVAMLAGLAWLATPNTARAAVTDIRINEIESSVTGGQDFIELTNKGAVPVDISGLVIKDNDDTHAYTIPDGTTIAPGGFWVVEIDTVPGGFGLGGGDSVRLFNGAELLDSHTWTAHAGVTWGRCPDGNGEFVNTLESTPGAANKCATPEGVVVINEIESQAGSPDDWIELKNIGDAPVDVAGYVLRDNSDDHTYTIPAGTGTTIAPGGYLVVDIATAAGGFGLGGADAVRFYEPGGLVLIDSHSWTSHSPTSIARCGDGIGGFTNSAAPTKGAANDCPIPSVVINEIVSNSSTLPDSIELHNAGTTDVDLSGYILKDDNDSRNVPLPAGSVIAAGGYLVFSEGSGFTFGLGNGDAARLFLPDGTTLVDGHTYPAHGVPGWARCGDMWVQPASLTLGAANDCGTSPTPTTPAPTGPTAQPWPGGDAATPLNLAFLEDSSGLDFQWDGTAGVLWAIDNGTGTLWKLTVSASGEVAFADGWQSGKRVRFIRDAADPASAGPDAEGVTFANGFVYVASERDNKDKGVNQNTILKVDPNEPGPDVVADQEWDITASLPAVSANTGIEAVEFIPDSALAGKLWDSAKAKPYDPADYPGHGDGLFFAAVEDNGTVYAFALNADGTHALVGSFTPGLGGVMALDWDAELGVLWTMCDDGCQNTGAQVSFNGTDKPGVVLLAKAAGLPVANFEGFATASGEMCVDGVRPVWWFQDGVTSGALRQGTVPCGADDPGTPPVSTPPVSTPPAGTPPVSTPPVTTPPADPNQPRPLPNTGA